jgi:hypothetical protein
MTEPETPASPPGNQSVQLGIGTLAIIAIIVTMCSGRSETQKVQKDTAELKRQVSEINRKLDTLIATDVSTPTPDVEAPADPATSSTPKP